MIDLTQVHENRAIRQIGARVNTASRAFDSLEAFLLSGDNFGTAVEAARLEKNFAEINRVLSDIAIAGD